MVWWGWLIVAIVVVITAIVAWSISRWTAPRADVDREAMAVVERAKAEAKAVAAETARQSIEAERRRLAERLKAVDAWFQASKEALAKETRDEYEALAGDPAALDAELDRILSDAKAGAGQGR